MLNCNNTFDWADLEIFLPVMHHGSTTGVFIAMHIGISKEAYHKMMDYRIYMSALKILPSRR